MLELRDENKYGLFKANSDKGEVKLSISIYGWGELFEIEGVNKNNERFEIIIDTSKDFDDDSDFYKETEESIDLFDEDGYEIIKLYKPFTRYL